MKTKDLYGNVTNWSIKGETISGEDHRSRSSLHLAARSLIKSLFPTLQIMEEVPVQVKAFGPTLFFDFFINTNKLVIEVQGQQHYKFNSLFHTSARDFLIQKKNDADKQEWCKINNITYLELPYNESLEEWKKRIIQR